MNFEHKEFNIKHAGHYPVFKAPRQMITRLSTQPKDWKYI
jgi:hypothetical protein